eukprot:3265370-Amphidinium_carterae.1
MKSLVEWLGFRDAWEMGKDSTSAQSMSHRLALDEILRCQGIVDTVRHQTEQNEDPKIKGPRALQIYHTQDLRIVSGFCT